ncbi:PadR family transcriptional regulator [Rhodococcus sp. NPDC056516]|uniref:PadR family transcriptional regulator n=1 Tax=Rhodococcus sp. NPDC056516 TaxID=3345847 RepID=UPI00366E405E
MRLEFVVLGMLAMSPLSGYDIRKWMDGPGQYLGYGVQLPHIYRTMPKLIGKGWVEFEVDPRDGKPDAKVYRLTDTGHTALLDWARSPYTPSPRPSDPDFKLRLLFAGQLGPDIAIELIRTELDFRIAQAASPGWQAFVEMKLQPAPGIDASWVHELHTTAHEHGYTATAGYIAWLQLALAKFEREAMGMVSSVPYRGQGGSVDSPAPKARP